MTQAAPILLHRQGRARPALALAPEVALALGRAHEVCGPARRVLAALVAGRLAGPVLWILPAHEGEALHADGLAPWMDPGRLVIVPVRRAPDMLWCMEEALRAGACPLVVAELPEPPGLTPVRRLHLAAEAGGDPLGLILTPEGAAPGVESRWHLAPRPGWAAAGAPRWQLTRLRARTAPEAGWEMEAGSGGLHPVAEPVDRGGKPCQPAG
jgi:protein ImuA